jgi:hypothetical protein
MNEAKTVVESDGSLKDTHHDLYKVLLIEGCLCELIHLGPRRSEGIVAGGSSDFCLNVRVSFGAAGGTTIAS